MLPHSWHGDQDAARLLRLDTCWASLAAFGALTSGLMALAFTILRLGLVSPVALTVSGVAIVAAAAFAPLLLPRRGKLADPHVRALTYPLVSFMVFASVLLALPFGTALQPVYLLLA